MPESNKINFAKIEQKWQKRWADKKAFEVKEPRTPAGTKKPKFYVLEMFPYPSGSGLHMGHAWNYSIGDVFARFKLMQGFNVLHPMGYDALGLPAENAAIKDGTHPEDYTKKSMKHFMKQQKMLGLSYDWSRIINTSSPDYYKWDQWIFLKMLEKGLAYQKEASVNWCPSCKTVLANEQAQTGNCERCGTKVELKTLRQWFFKITDYAEELLDKIDDLDWPSRTKAMQKNWIGKSYGAEIDFEIESFGKFPVFTTRPDTIYGVTFMVISAQHPKLMDIVANSEKKKVEAFLKRVKGVSEKQMEDMEKEGIFTGSYAINPVTNEKVPVYAGNFVVADYGSGMVMAVPAHDQRDFEFAKKYEIPIKVVIDPVGQEIEKPEKMTHAYTEKGNLINSGEFSGLENSDAKKKIVAFLERKKIGRNKVQFKLRDWLISRQRYWGTPIPVVYCNDCGVVAVKEKDLPVKLPKEVKFGEGNPLLTNDKWVKTKCPNCGNKDSKRETDTMDTFVNSSWYFLRYADSKNDKKIFDPKKVDYWCPIDQYIGGAEHACMHLIYFRFYTKFLRDLGLLKFDEPAIKLFHQGMLHGEDGDKMSKSKGNVVLPETVSEKYGIDTARMFLISVASPDKDIDWSEKGIDGSLKFINKLFDFFSRVELTKKSSPKIESKLNKIIKEVTNQIESFKYNLAIIKVRELFNTLFDGGEVSKDVLEKSLKLLSPFCPHVSEELWEKIKGKGFISLSEWPKPEDNKIDERFEKQDEAVEKLVGDIININKIVESKGESKENVYVYVLPNELDFFSDEEISKRIGKPVKVYAVNDKDKYDPNNISKKAKPHKPGIYFE